MRRAGAAGYGAAMRHRPHGRAERTAWATVAVALFVAYVVHAAYAASAVCPAVGTCASVHLALLRGGPAERPVQVAALDTSVPVH